MTDIPSMQRPGREPNRAERLEATLHRVFSASQVQVSDHSAEHSGHAGARPEGETHYKVLVVSGQFRGMSRIARSRAVHDAVAREFANGLHALSLTLRTPEEQARYEQDIQARS
jgi:stress-induced morphogen